MTGAVDSFCTFDDGNKDDASDGACDVSNGKQIMTGSSLPC